MKRLLLYIVILVGIFSCSTSPDTKKQQDVDDIKVNQVDVQVMLDSLTQLKDELEIELELLKENFDYKQENFNGKSYYHNNWWGKYYISDQAILAGVDSLGNFFLIANVWTYAYRDMPLDSIQIIIDTAIYSASSDTLLLFSEPIMVVCACGFHQAYFTDSKAQNIGRVISQNPDKKISWLGMKTLTNRDKIGIKECFDLSEKLQCISDIENQIEQIKVQ